MIMNREEGLKKAAEQYGLTVLDNADLHVNYEEDNYDAGERDAILQFTSKAFVDGAEWADAHPKRDDNECTFCRGEEFVTHKSKECDLSYDDSTFYVGIDIPQVGCSASALYGFVINYCPMCGRKLSK